MADAIPYAVVAMLAVGAWVGGVALMDVFTAADARAWRRMAQLRGFASRGSTFERVARRAPMLKRLQSELDLERLLGQANSHETPASFLARTGAISLMTFALLLAAMAGARALEGEWPVAPWASVLIALLIPPLSLVDLRRRARVAREVRPELSGICSWRSRS